MPTARPDVTDFLLTRRSCPAKTLGLPVPGRDEVRVLLTAAARSPDHGKLEPWRFIVLERAALERLAAAVPARGAALGLEAERIEKMHRQFADAHLVVAVIGVPRPTEKIPAVEQVLSTGAVCLALLNAALAAGWGANWLTGWAAYDRGFLDETLHLAPQEFVAGFVHVGTATWVAPDRPRPDVAALTTWAAT
jgi:nitroreductase